MTSALRSVVASTFLCLACDSPTPVTPTVAPNDRVASISLTYAVGSAKVQGLLVGVPEQLAFVARDANGFVVPDAQPTFHSSDSTGVVVSSTGLATALRAPMAAIVSATVVSNSRTLADSVRVLTTILLESP